MHDVISHAMLHGVAGGTPWRDADVAFLCPVPRYDPHFAICEAMGIRMIPVPFVEGALDLDAIRKLVVSDGSIRGMWCVPMFSNPTGTTCSLEEVEAKTKGRPLPATSGCYGTTPHPDVPRRHRRASPRR